MACDLHLNSGISHLDRYGFSEENIVREFHLDDEEQAVFKRAVYSFRSGIEFNDGAVRRIYKVFKFALYSAKERAAEKLGIKRSDWKKGIEMLADKMGGGQENLEKAELMILICGSKYGFFGDPMPPNVGGLTFRRWAYLNLGSRTMCEFKILQNFQSQSIFREVHGSAQFERNLSRLIAEYAVV